LQAENVPSGSLVAPVRDRFGKHFDFAKGCVEHKVEKAKDCYGKNNQCNEFQRSALPSHDFPKENDKDAEYGYNEKGAISHE